MIRTVFRRFVAWTVLVPVVAGSAPHDGTIAMRAEIVPPTFAPVAVDVLESMPPRFELVLHRDMPTAGWSVRAVGVERESGSNRLRVDLVESPPEGPVAQVITPVEVRVDLGPLPPGRHVVELWLRTDGQGEAAPVQVEVVAALER